MLLRVAPLVLWTPALLATGCSTIVGVEEWTAGATSGSGAAGGSGMSATGSGGAAASSGGQGAGGMMPRCDPADEGSQYQLSVLASCPAGYWRLGEARAVPTAFDTSGNANHGTYEDSTVLGAQGALGGDSDTAIEMTPGTGRVDVGDRFDFVATSSFSLEAWVRPETADTEVRRIVGKEDPTFSAREGYLLAFHSGGVALERWRGDEKNAVPWFPIASESYSHIVGTFDGTTMRLYVQGVLADTAPSNLELLDLEESFTIGASPAKDKHFNGLIDEVAVYPRELTAKEILAHFAAGSSD